MGGPRRDDSKRGGLVGVPVWSEQGEQEVQFASQDSQPHLHPSQDACPGLPVSLMLPRKGVILLGPGSQLVPRKVCSTWLGMNTEVSRKVMFLLVLLGPSAPLSRCSSEMDDNTPLLPLPSELTQLRLEKLYGQRLWAEAMLGRTPNLI